jgi:transposase InsO family protein
MSSRSLSTGSVVRFAGEMHTVIAFGSPLILRSEAGHLRSADLVDLLSAPDFELDGAELGDEIATSTLLDTLTDRERKKLDKRLADLNEVLTGYRSGDPENALPSEPRPEYDPSTTTQEQRISAKAHETHRSGRTIKRDLKRYRAQGLWGLVDKRAARPINSSILEPRVHTAVEHVLGRLTERSTLSHAETRRLVQQELDRGFGVGVVQCPPRSTFDRALVRLLKARGIYRASAKARRSVANRPETPYRHFYATRPGEYVQIDCSPYDIFAVDPVTGEWISLVLVIALDLYSRSIPAWAFTPKDAKAVDAALLLHDITCPKPMRPGWPEDARWRYLGVPENILVASGANGDLTAGFAGIPALHPETVIVDGGRIFLSETFQEGCMKLGTSILLTRPRRPTDKPQIERAFRTIREELVEKLPGYKGPDIYSRGAKPEDEAFLLISELEDTFAQFVALNWQERPQKGLRLPEQPKVFLSPNRMYDEGVARWGSIRIPTGTSPHNLLPTVWRKIHHYGVQFNNLYYDGEALNGYRNVPSPYNGKHAGAWPIKYDPRDLSRVYFQDPTSGEWAELRWIGSTSNRPFSGTSLQYVKRLISNGDGYGCEPAELERRLNDLVERAWQNEPRNRSEQRLAAKERIRQWQVSRRNGSQPRDLPVLEGDSIGDLFAEDDLDVGEPMEAVDPDEDALVWD